MQQLSKKQHRTPLTQRLKLGALVGIGLLLAVGAVLPNHRPTLVEAATCNSISACSAEIARTQDKVSDLKDQALSYQDAIAGLNAQINQVQTQINRNVTKQHHFEKEIAQKQAEITKQRGVLASLLKSMYVDDQMSTIEMLATSKNLSDYVDKEEYRTAVQNKIQTTLIEIANLQKKLRAEKTEVQQLVAEETSQRNSLASARAEQNKLLGYNQSQQASYNAQTAANKSKLQALIAAQRAANESSSPGGYYFLRFPGTGHSFNPGNYPYRNAGFSMSTLPGCGHPDPYTGSRDSYDRWGYCTRQCVSFAAWAVEASGGNAPENYGSAKNWVYAARRDGIPVYSSPQPGDIAISTHGTWGHAMYVESVSGSYFHAMQYNQHLDGRYSENDRQWL
jgi:surface antigen/peptidoglycan hydrolase CwlO-like protein